MVELAGKSILITGAASGMGREAALLAAKAGAKVTVADMNAALAKATVDEIVAAGGTAQCFIGDITDEAQVKAMVDAVVSAYGRIDAAYNNAGVPNTGKVVHELSQAEFRRVMDINVVAVFLCMKYEIAAMLKTGGGAIVNSASAAGAITFNAAVDYVGSKHAVMGMTKSAALDYATQGIRVNAVMPGVVRTPMLAGLFASTPEAEEYLVTRTPMGRLGEPQEIAKAALWLMSEDASFITGTGLAVDGAYVAT